MLLVVAARATARETLDDATRAAAREGLAQAGRGESADDNEIAAIFGPARRHEHNRKS